MGKNMTVYGKILLWLVVADAASTVIGIEFFGWQEVNPNLHALIATGGLLLFAVYKIGLTLFCLVVIEKIWKTYPQERAFVAQWYRYGIAFYVLTYIGSVWWIHVFL